MLSLIILCQQSSYLQHSSKMKTKQKETNNNTKTIWKLVCLNEKYPASTIQLYVQIIGYTATFSIYLPDGFLLWKQSLGLSKQCLTASVSDGPYRAPHISAEALATDVSVFANKAAVRIMQTGRPDQPSDSMRLHRTWPARVGFICHACVPSQERHRIISSINRCRWLIGLVLNKHGNDPLTLYTEARSSRGFISHLRLWCRHVIIFHFCLFGILEVCMCV